MKAIQFTLSAALLTTTLLSCGVSEKFVQDDVYASRTPLVPIGTDLNDPTDYAAFVQKKERSKENTAYYTPQYGNLSYDNRMPKNFYGPTGGLSSSYGSWFRSLYYPGYFDHYRSYYLNMGSLNGYPGYFNYPNYYYGNGLCSYNNMYYYHDLYGYNNYFGYGYGGYGYGNGYGYGYPMGHGYGNGSGYYNSFGQGATYAPQSKHVNTGNVSSASAGSTTGRYGSSTGGNVIYYQNGMKTAPSSPTVGRNTAVTYADLNSRTTSSSTTSTPVVVNRPTTARTAQPTVARPTTATSSASGRTGATTYSNGNPQIRRTDGVQTPSRQVSPSMNSTRSSSPTFNSSPSSSPSGRGSVGAPSGGRR